METTSPFSTVYWTGLLPTVGRFFVQKGGENLVNLAGFFFFFMKLSLIGFFFFWPIMAAQKFLKQYFNLRYIRLIN